MNRTALMGGCAILLLAGVGTVALAQEIENTPDTLVFSLETAAKFEDNRDATKRNKEEMLSLWLTPGVRFTVDDGLTRAILAYRPSLVARDNEREDQNDLEWYHAVDASIRHEASMRLVLGGLNRFEMTDDPRVTEGGVTVRENASYWVNQSKAWMSYGLTERGQVDLDASYKLKRYDKRTFSDLGDEDRLLVNGAFRHRMAPDFHGFLFAGYDQPSFQNGVRGDYRGYLGGVGLERQFNDQWKGSIALGYEFLDYQDAAEHDTSLPYVKAAAQARPGARLTVDAEAEYSLEPSDRSLYSSKEYLRLLMRGTLALSESLSAFGQAVYANGAYDAKSGIEDETRRVDDQAVVDGDDTLVDLQVGLLFRPQTGRYTGRLAYEFEDWDSDVRESFTRNTMMASVSVDF